MSAAPGGSTSVTGARAREGQAGERSARRDQETKHPGYLGSQDTYYVGNLKGVGRNCPQTVIDLDPKSKDYARVEAASKCLGNPGDRKGVTIKSTEMAGRRFAQADQGDVITIDLGKISTKATSVDPDAAVIHGAGALGHEARHQIDDKNIFGSRGPQSKAQEYRTEMNAFNTQGAVYRGLGRRTALDTPEDVAAATQRATDDWCDRGGNC